ncbi:Uncharacterised protein [Vibrio cholerae]|nr:Uncharacterised protein [Vibrio cholerae]
MEYRSVKSTCYLTPSWPVFCKPVRSAGSIIRIACWSFPSVYLGLRLPQ